MTKSFDASEANVANVFRRYLGGRKPCFRPNFEKLKAEKTLKVRFRRDPIRSKSFIWPFLPWFRKTAIILNLKNPQLRLSLIVYPNNTFDHRFANDGNMKVYNFVLGLVVKSPYYFVLRQGSTFHCWIIFPFKVNSVSREEPFSLKVIGGSSW